jgi:hypothetical protein
MSDRMYTADEVVDLVNDAANAVDSAADLPDEGARDALNLVVNIVGTWVRDPDGERKSVTEVIEANYETAPDVVLGWCGS